MCSLTRYSLSLSSHVLLLQASANINATIDLAQVALELHASAPQLFLTSSIQIGDGEAVTDVAHVAVPSTRLDAGQNWIYANNASRSSILLTL